MPANISAVIVSYNTRDLLRRAIGSLQGARVGPVEVLVIDNASLDGTPSMVRSDYPDARLVSLTRNYGFAAAANMGMRLARGRQLLLLNPDAELLDGALDQLSSFLDETPWAAAVGPRLIYPDGRWQHSAFKFPGLTQILLDFFPLHRRVLDSRFNGRYPPAAEPHPIDHPLGACMLLRREALDDVGLLDDGFFMYCEEVDWCLRAHNRGWAIFHHPQAVAVHHSGKSTEQQQGAMYVQLQRSRLRLYRKHRGRLFQAAARTITEIGLRVRIARLQRAGNGNSHDQVDREAMLQACEAALALTRR